MISSLGKSLIVSGSRIPTSFVSSRVRSMIPLGWRGANSLLFDEDGQAGNRQCRKVESVRCIFTPLLVHTKSARR